MKTFVLIAALFFISGQSFSQNFGIWRQGDTNGFTPRFALTSSAIDGKIYVLGGNEDGRYENGSPVYQSNKLEIYDVTSNSWSTPQTTGMFTTRQYLASAAVAGKIYAIGGVDGLDTSTVEVFDPFYNSWTAVPSMPTPRHGLTASVIDNKIYAIGGINGSEWLSTLEVFDPQAGSSGTWNTPVTAGWFRPMYYMTASVVNNKIYIFGGSDGNGALDSVYIFDPASNSWTSPATTGNFTPRQKLTSSVINNKIYVIGGEDSFGTALNTVEVFDPANNSWDTVITKDSLTARFSLTSSAVGNSIYVLGGTLDQETLYNLNEIFTPSTSGVKSNMRNDNISISPNPAHTFVSLHGSNITHVALRDMLGRIVTENSYPSSADIILNLSGLTEGIYYAECIGKNFMIVKKIVKD